MVPDTRPWPTELRLAKDKKALTVTFDTGESFALDAEYLRVMSPSAEVQGHSPDERKTQPGKRNVAILEVHPIGNYAVRLVFDDTHSTGIYSWDYLRELGQDRERKWQVKFGAEARPAPTADRIDSRIADRRVRSADSISRSVARRSASRRAAPSSSSTASSLSA